MTAFERENSLVLGFSRFLWPIRNRFFSESSAINGFQVAAKKTWKYQKNKRNEKKYKKKRIKWMHWKKNINFYSQCFKCEIEKREHISVSCFGHIANVLTNHMLWLVLHHLWLGICNVIIIKPFLMADAHRSEFVHWCVLNRWVMTYYSKPTTFPTAMPTSSQLIKNKSPHRASILVCHSTNPTLYWLGCEGAWEKSCVVAWLYLVQFKFDVAQTGIFSTSNVFEVTHGQAMNTFHDVTAAKCLKGTISSSSSTHSIQEL